MDKRKILATIPILPTLATPMVTFAATNYATTNAYSTNIENPITSDEDINKVNVSVTQGSTFSVSIPKTIVLDGDADKANESTYTINVDGNIASDEVIVVEPDTTFTMSDVKGIKKDLNGTISQTITKFVDNEVNLDNTLTSFQHIGGTTGTVSINNLTSGEWTGSFNFKIKLHTHSFNESIENEATSEEEGSKKLSCEECGLFVTQSIPKLQEKLNGYTWDEVQAICKAGKAKDYFKVGDTAVISLGALPDTYNETSAQKATIVVGDMTDTSLTLLVTSYSVEAPRRVINKTGTNAGGWASTTMRSWLNGEYLSALPSDLQKVITTHSTSYSSSYNAGNVSYCNDKVWLLSSKEVFGGEIATSTDTTYYENLVAFNAESQLAYFANGNSKMRYTNSNKTSACWWWLRSSYYNSIRSFTCISSDDAIRVGTAENIYFVFPAFEIS
jgi:hypothetical protein